MRIKELLECLESTTQVVIEDRETKKSSRGTASDLFNRAEDNYEVIDVTPKEGKLIIGVSEIVGIEIPVRPKDDVTPIPTNMYNELLYLGIIDPTGVRSNNVGKSNYPGHLIQAWTIWLAYPELTSWDHDIIKRVLRTKEEVGMTIEEARIMDYQKIIHICNERIRQLNLLKSK